MSEEKLIDPAWLVKARKNRKKFAVRVVLVFAILSVLAWWALPHLADNYEKFKVARSPKKAIAEPASVKTLAWLAGWFKVLWAAIGIGCAAAILIGFTGKIDSLIPVFNIAALLIGLGAVGLTIYVYYAPTLLLLEGAR